MNREWQYNFRAHRGAWLAAAMFVLVFALYIAKHQGRARVQLVLRTPVGVPGLATPMLRGPISAARCAR